MGSPRPCHLREPVRRLCWQPSPQCRPRSWSTCPQHMRAYTERHRHKHRHSHDTGTGTVQDTYEHQTNNVDSNPISRNSVLAWPGGETDLGETELRQGGRIFAEHARIHTPASTLLRRGPETTGGAVRPQLFLPKWHTQQRKGGWWCSEGINECGATGRGERPVVHADCCQDGEYAPVHHPSCSWQ